MLCMNYTVNEFLAQRETRFGRLMDESTVRDYNSILVNISVEIIHD